ncbi:MAG: PucR family transcriptional regulator [Actinobacteria bacterium RBG_16_64_13]|nr:MAG: PucR family transcriptional regulator [Actinobacteria bacterium RBG_16_64_13]
MSEERTAGGKEGIEGLPSLREILALPAFAGAELLSGESRLDEPVTWVHVSELMDAWRFLSGGEVLVSTGLELARATAPAREAYLRSLVEAGAQGLVLELVQWLLEVPGELLLTARLTEFPLVVFREEVRFADLTKAAHERILRPHVPSDREHWLDSLLAALVETGRSAGFMEGQLGPVLALPGRPRGILLATLEALLAYHFNIAETARKLGVRRQSIYYRLEQLEGMLGDLDEPYRRTSLVVALELLKHSPS